MALRGAYMKIIQNVFRSSLVYMMSRIFQLSSDRLAEPICSFNFPSWIVRGCTVLEQDSFGIKIECTDK